MNQTAKKNKKQNKKQQRIAIAIMKLYCKVQ